MVVIFSKVCIVVAGWEGSNLLFRCCYPLVYPSSPASQETLCMSRSQFRARLVQWLESRPLAYMAALVALNVKATVTRPALGSGEVEHHSTQGLVDSIEGY